MARIFFHFLVVLSQAANFAANGEGFLVGHRSPRQPSLLAGMGMQSAELQAALNDVIACSSGKERAHRETVKDAVLPIWRSMPKNSYDRVEWKSLRYIAHRYFMQRFAVMVRGLEPIRQVNMSHAGGAEILSEQVPMVAKQLLNVSNEQHGFAFDDAVAIIAALEHVVFDTERGELEALYRKRGWDTRQSVSSLDLQMLLREYIVYWMSADDVEGAQYLLSDERLLNEHIPHWKLISMLMRGSVKTMEFAKRRRPGAGDAAVAFSGRHSFEDAFSIVKEVGKSFASFWEPQCQDIKQSLAVMDTMHTGRVTLADFYGANKEGEWRFGESEAYLRELGALDESSPWRGVQVIISNYLQAASNCIISRQNYLICCVNECEGILGDIEAALGVPVAEPEAILQLVGNMTTDDDDPILLDGALHTQLMRVASAHGGKVPLHGRLFAQWLHYAFPRECAFPHKAGAASATTPSEFGDGYVISPDEVEQRVAESVIQQDLNPDASAPPPVADWMTQWSEDEDLPGDYSLQLRAPWDTDHLAVLGGAAAAAASVVGLLWATAGRSDEIGPYGPVASAPTTTTKLHSV
mmetsp:Transcript_110733/g.319911  ORF Transcript_110733/g.319911 Transcript_110733/m.319911 type:complete len:580 (-) Transcript_110733:55-1794(-)